MANRLNAPNQFETLSPPWILSQLDTNFTQNQAAWNDSSLGFVNGIPIDTGSANAYTVALPFGSPSAYQDGMTVPFIPANTNTGASTITVSPLGSVAILTPAGNALQGGELAASKPAFIVYKSAVPTGFRIVGSSPLSLNTTTSAITLTIECAGYTSASALVTFTGAGITITLAHLAQGVPVSLAVTNTSGSAHGVNLAASSPAGTAYTFIGAFPSGSVNGVVGVNMISTGVTLNNNVTMTFTGGAVAPLQLYLAS